MKIIFSKNNYYFERNEGIEPTTSNWNVRILPSELIPQVVAQVGLEPTRPFRSKGFSYHYSFHYQSYKYYFEGILRYLSMHFGQAVSYFRLFVVWTLSSPY